MASLTIAEFLISFGDAFAEADRAMVEAKLAAAHRAYAGCADYPQYPDIVGNHAAHLIASSPGGESMRLTKDSSETIYSIQRDQLLRGIPSGPVLAL